MDDGVCAVCAVCAYGGFNIAMLWMWDTANQETNAGGSGEAYLTEQIMDNGKQDRRGCDGRPKVLSELKQAAREHSEAAIETLAAVINDESTTTAARVAAARAILRRKDTLWTDALRVAVMRASEDGRLLLARISEMRERLAEKGARRPFGPKAWLFWCLVKRREGTWAVGDLADIILRASCAMSNVRDLTFMNWPETES
jgi:hypothetical protein